MPASAAIGFLVATPELGLDAILISIPLLGPELTGVRLIAAFVVAYAVAVFVGRGLRSIAPMEQHSDSTPPPPVQTRLKNGVHFGLVELFDHTFPWVLAGLLVAAWAEPILNESVFATIPSYLQVPLFAIIGIPVYVCASGSTPLAAIAIHKGISPGAAIAFLIAGPATNVTTFGILVNSTVNAPQLFLVLPWPFVRSRQGCSWTISRLTPHSTYTLISITHRTSSAG